VGRKWLSGDVTIGRWSSRRERRGLRGALVFGVVVRHRHRRRNVSVWFLYAGTRWLAVCLTRRLFAAAMWRRRGQSMCGKAPRRVDIVAGAAVAVGSRCVWLVGLTCCALVLRWREDGIIGRRHSPIERGEDRNQGFTGYT
jgi:hypothetical protein